MGVFLGKGQESLVGQKFSDEGGERVVPSTVFLISHGD